MAPLFYAFGLITVEELHAADPSSTVLDTNFVSWLQETVQEAVRTAEQHELLKGRIRKYRDTLQHRFQLSAVQVRDGQFSAGVPVGAMPPSCYCQTPTF